jgi:hypothetical protein
MDPDHDLVVSEDPLALPLDEADDDRPARGELALQIGDLAADEEGRQITAAGEIAHAARLEARRRHGPELVEDPRGRLGRPIRHEHRDGGGSAIGLGLLADEPDVLRRDPAGFPGQRVGGKWFRRADVHRARRRGRDHPDEDGAHGG